MRLSSDRHIHHLMLSARYWEEFSFVCNKIILELRNHEPINPGKLCQPSFLKSALITCLLRLLICI